MDSFAIGDEKIFCVIYLFLRKGGRSNEQAIFFLKNIRSKREDLKQERKIFK